MNNIWLLMNVCLTYTLINKNSTFCYDWRFHKNSWDYTRITDVMLYYSRAKTRWNIDIIGESIYPANTESKASQVHLVERHPSPELQILSSQRERTKF